MQENLENPEENMENNTQILREILRRPIAMQTKSKSVRFSIPDSTEDETEISAISPIMSTPSDDIVKKFSTIDELWGEVCKNRTFVPNFSDIPTSDLKSKLDAAKVLTGGSHVERWVRAVKSALIERSSPEDLAQTAKISKDEVDAALKGLQEDHDLNLGQAKITFMDIIEIRDLTNMCLNQGRSEFTFEGAKKIINSEQMADDHMTYSERIMIKRSWITKNMFNPDTLKSGLFPYFAGSDPSRLAVSPSVSSRSGDDFIDRPSANKLGSFRSH